LVIEYRSKQIEKVCISADEARKKYGIDMAYAIQKRIGEIEAADTVELMIQFRIGRCHPLKGKRKGQYAVDLVHPYRLIFSVLEGTIVIAYIEEIVDYH
jgi:plasmid maintenance system killer protein